MPRHDETQLINVLLDDVGRPRGQAEDDNLAGLMVGDVGIMLEFQIDGFLSAAAVPTSRERSDFAFFFFEFKVEDFMVDGVRVGIVLKAGGSTVNSYLVIVSYVPNVIRKLC